MILINSLIFFLWNGYYWWHEFQLNVELLYVIRAISNRWHLFVDCFVYVNIALIFYTDYLILKILTKLVLLLFLF